MKSKIHISSYIVLCMVLITLTTTPTQARSVPDNLEERVDAYIRETMDRLPIPGLALGIVQGDQVLYLQGYGTANTDDDPVTPQTPFMLASVAKTFTALAVQQLATAGKIELDQPAQTYLPEFHLSNEEMATAITVRHLLDHTSGISTNEGNQPYLHSPDASFEEVIEKLARFTPLQSPGQQFEYSNWNYVLLGEIISRASGERYADYVQNNILDPLEMPHTTFADHHTLPGAATGNLIVFGASVPYDEPHLPVMLSAGYLNSTAEDMAHYLIAFFNHGTYNRHNLLPDQGLGWYDAIWNWHTGMPDDISYGFSGGHNSINTNIQLFSLHQVGVVVLMNTRLDQFIPGPVANDIAFNIARITINFPYEVPSNREFYMGYGLLDGVLLLMIVSLIWQASTLGHWKKHYPSATRSKRIAARVGIIFNLILFIIILVLPMLLGVRWNIILHFRPDFVLPIAGIGLCFGAVGLMKISSSVFSGNDSKI